MSDSKCFTLEIWQELEAPALVIQKREREKNQSVADLLFRSVVRSSCRVKLLPDDCGWLTVLPSNRGSINGLIGIRVSNIVLLDYGILPTAEPVHVAVGCKEASSRSNFPREEARRRTDRHDSFGGAAGLCMTSQGPNNASSISNKCSVGQYVRELLVHSTTW